MRTLLSLAAVAALALTVAMPVRAATADEGFRNANAQMHHHRHWAPRKAHYGRGMRAHFHARCKMSGSC